MEKMDLEFIEEIVNSCSVPVIGTSEHHLMNILRDSFKNKCICNSSGSIFVYHGPHKAVLINYPSYETKTKLTSL